MRSRSIRTEGMLAGRETSRRTLRSRAVLAAESALARRIDRRSSSLRSSRRPPTSSRQASAEEVPAGERPVHVPEHHLHRGADTLVQGEARGGEQGRVRAHRPQRAAELVAGEGEEPGGAVVGRAMHGAPAPMPISDVHEPTRRRTERVLSARFLTPRCTIVEKRAAEWSDGRTPHSPAAGPDASGAGRR